MGMNVAADYAPLTHEREEKSVDDRGHVGWIHFGVRAVASVVRDPIQYTQASNITLIPCLGSTFLSRRHVTEATITNLEARPSRAKSARARFNSSCDRALGAPSFSRCVHVLFMILYEMFMK